MRSLLFLTLLTACGGDPEPEFITLASTTSPDNAGLYKVLLPKFQEATGIEVRAMPVGTGKALRIGRDGHADVVFVHNRELEEKFVADGFGVERLAVMKNEFILVGPPDDPAKIGPLKDGAQALRRIAASRATFISRGDESGTHRRELKIWKRAGIDPKPFSGSWYQEAGQGMGATLNVAVGKGAYCLTDSSTWGAFRNKGELKAIFFGDPKLQNPYTVIVAAKSAKRKLAQKFADWLTGPEGQAIIRDCKVNGVALFIPTAPRAN
ncbi:MAG: ABC transporter substrate-binding protein [Planctomycetota bacterium]|jgi:tungstate transport system substrate-binding protein